MVCCQIEATCLLGMRSLVGGDIYGILKLIFIQFYSSKLYAYGRKKIE